MIFVCLSAFICALLFPARSQSVHGGLGMRSAVTGKLLGQRPQHHISATTAIILPETAALTPAQLSADTFAMEGAQ